MDIRSFCMSYNSSKKVEKELLILFHRHLPSPNNLFYGTLSSLYIAQCPRKQQSKVFVFGRRRANCLGRAPLSELHYRIVEATGLFFPCNSKPFQQNEILLILNLDGVHIFKSKKFNVWPLWLQWANLPPKFRPSFHNISLLGLGHGLQKPEWNQILMGPKFELDILQQFHVDTNLGCICKCKKASLVCDMPVKTAGLNMNHFNGLLWLHTFSSDWLSRGS